MTTTREAAAASKESKLEDRERLDYIWEADETLYPNLVTTCYADIQSTVRNPSGKNPMQFNPSDFAMKYCEAPNNRGCFKLPYLFFDNTTKKLTLLYTRGCTDRLQQTCSKIAISSDQTVETREACYCRYDLCNLGSVVSTQLQTWILVSVSAQSHKLLQYSLCTWN